MSTRLTVAFDSERYSTKRACVMRFLGDSTMANAFEPSMARGLQIARGLQRGRDERLAGAARPFATIWPIHLRTGGKGRHTAV